VVQNLYLGAALLAPPALAALTGLLALRARRGTWAWAAGLSAFWGALSLAASFCIIGLSGIADGVTDVGAILGIVSSLLILLASLALLNSHEDPSERAG
jgi:hypothetical protein